VVKLSFQFSPEVLLIEIQRLLAPLLVQKQEALNKIAEVEGSGHHLSGAIQNAQNTFIRNNLDPQIEPLEQQIRLLSSQIEFNSEKEQILQSQQETPTIDTNAGQQEKSNNLPLILGALAVGLIL